MVKRPLVLRSANKDKHVMFYFLFLRMSANDYFLKDEKNNNHTHVAHIWQLCKSTK